MLSIRNLLHQDLDVANSIVRAAYNSNQDQRPALLQYLTLQPQGWFIASLDSIPVGLVGATIYGSFAYVGLMSVLPTVQRQGVGHALMAHLLKWIKQQGCSTTLLDASEAGFPLYQHFHFIVDDTVAHWSLDSEEQLTSSPYTSILNHNDISALSGFDARYFGAERERVLYAYQQQLPDRAFYMQNVHHEYNGYIFARERVIGPWVASDPKSAEWLLCQALSLPFSSTPQIFMPSTNVHGNLLLEQYGFKRLRILHHMRIGLPITGRMRANIYGQASLGLG